MKKILEKKVIIEGKNKDGLNIFDLASLNPNSTLVLLENYNDSYEYRLYKKTYPFHVAVINRDYDLLDLKRFDINLAKAMKVTPTPIPAGIRTIKSKSPIPCTKGV